MAFCVKCGNQMSEAATFCGKCGNRTLAPAEPKKKTGAIGKILKLAGGLLLLLIGVGVISALVNSKPDTGAGPAGSAAVRPKPDLKVSARDLAREYEANSIAADLKYKGKLVEVDGEIKDINRDIINSIYVVLSSQNPESITDVQLYFSDAHEKEAAGLSKGEYFAAVCQCDGKFMNVIMKNCETTVSETPH